jgi:hypothetical protein
MGYSTELANLVQNIDDSVEEVDFSNKSFTKLDGRLEIGGVGVFSDRASKNLCRWSGVPMALVKEVTLPVFNQLIQEQFHRRSYTKFRIGRNPTDKNRIVFIQPAQEPYLRYNDLIKPFEQSVWDVYGNPLEDDALRVVTKAMEINPNGEDMFVGQRIRVSNINYGKLSSDFMTYRVICKNGLINATHCQSYKIDTKNATPTFIADVLQARAKDCDVYGAGMKQFVMDADSKEVKDPVEVVCDKAEEAKFIPRRVIRDARVEGAALKSNEKSLKDSGIPSLETVWNWINLFTLLCQASTLFAVRENCEKGAYAWGRNQLSL